MTTITFSSIFGQESSSKFGFFGQCITSRDFVGKMKSHIHRNAFEIEIKKTNFTNNYKYIWFLDCFDGLNHQVYNIIECLKLREASYTRSATNKIQQSKISTVDSETETIKYFSMAWSMIWAFYFLFAMTYIVQFISMILKISSFSWKRIAFISVRFDSHSNVR